MLMVNQKHLGAFKNSDTRSNKLEPLGVEALALY